jgi:hypothetical protein
MSVTPLKIVLGSQDNLATTKVGDDWIIRFFSRGNEVCYPRDPMVLFQFMIVTSELDAVTQVFRCPYQINTDRGKSTRGTLTVRIARGAPATVNV